MNLQEWSDYLEQYNTIEHLDLPESTNKYCVIMEFRVCPRLIQVINNFISILGPKGWGLIIFHGTKNEEFLKTNLSGKIKHVKYCKLDFENIDAQMYSNFLTSEDFWESLSNIGCEHTLIFQIDTVLLRPDIDKFLQYDYIGAPWFNPWRCFAYGQFTTVKIGNGGLSLRKVRTMLDIIKRHPRNLVETPQLENEDIYFAYWFERERGLYHLPSPYIASEFSLETTWHPNPCGMHQPHLDKMPSIEEFKKLLLTRNTT